MAKQEFEVKVLFTVVMSQTFSMYAETEDAAAEAVLDGLTSGELQYDSMSAEYEGIHDYEVDYYEDVEDV